MLTATQAMILEPRDGQWPLMTQALIIPWEKGEQYASTLAPRTMPVMLVPRDEWERMQRELQQLRGYVQGGA